MKGMCACAGCEACEGSCTFAVSDLEVTDLRVKRLRGQHRVGR